MHSNAAHTNFMAHEHGVPAASSKEVVINYHLTQLCNYRCRYCYAQWGIKSPKDELHHNPEQVQRMLKVLHREFLPQISHRSTGTSQSTHCLRLNLVGGEPFLVKRFEEIIEAAQAIGFRASIVTNGSLLKDEFIERITPSPTDKHTTFVRATNSSSWFFCRVPCAARPP